MYNAVNVNLKNEMPQQNIQNMIKEDIIQKSKYFIDGKGLVILNQVIYDVLNRYVIVIDEKKDINYDWEEFNKTLVNKFLSTKEIEGCSSQTIKYYQKENKYFLDYVQKSILNVTNKDIKDYLSYVGEVRHCNYQTINNKRTVLDVTFQWFFNEGYTLENPVVTIKKIRYPKTLKEPYTTEEIELLRSVFDNPTCMKPALVLRNRVIFEMLLSSGIRVGELCKLNISDVNIFNCSMVVYGKGNKQRIVYFNIKTQLLLIEYLESRDDDYDCLFKSSRTSDNPRLTISAVENIIRRIGEEVNVKAHPHKFRRTFATNLLRKGTPLEQVKILLGHENIKTTQIYAITNENDVKINHHNLIG